jgi:hypothetical protein
VLVNGEKTENWIYNSFGKVTINIFRKNLSEKQTVDILKTI